MNPYVGEIRMFAGNFAPVGWALCDGSLQSISENETLFNLIGTTYGGDGQSTFALPDLRGRIPVHQGASYVVGAAGGVETVTLNPSQLPTHDHPLMVRTATDASGSPSLTSNNNQVLAGGTALAFSTTVPTSPMGPSAIGQVGGSQPHANFMPYLCVNFIISLFGIYPSQ